MAIIKVVQYSHAPKASSLKNTTTVIPSFNEKGNIDKVVRGLYCRGAKFPGAIRVVDDGSTDEGCHVGYCVEDNPGSLKRLTRRGIALIYHHEDEQRNPVNKGKTEAIRTGLSENRHPITTRYAAVIDGDTQHKAYDLGTLVTAADENRLNMVMGVRSDRYNPEITPPARAVANRIIEWVWGNFLHGIPLADSQCGMRLIQANCARGIRDNLRKVKHSRFVEKRLDDGYCVEALGIEGFCAFLLDLEQEMGHQLEARIGEVPIQTDYPKQAKSSIKAGVGPTNLLIGTWAIADAVSKMDISWYRRKA